VEAGYLAWVQEDCWTGGFANGQLHAGRRILLGFLEARFGVVESWLRWDIEHCKNVEVLIEAARQAGSAATVADLGPLFLVFSTSPPEAGRRPTVEHLLWYAAWEKGAAEAESAALRDVLRALLTERFGTLPQGYLDAIADTDDCQKLRQGVLRAARVGSLDEFHW
jgi:hypothetical protein